MISKSIYEWVNEVEYATQHIEPVLNRVGLVTRRHTAELNHSLNRLDRQLDELSDSIDEMEISENDTLAT